MMKRACKKTRENLMAFLTLQLKEECAREVKKHLAECSLCRAEAEETRAAWDLIKQADPDEDFRNISGGVLDIIRSAEHKGSLLEKMLTMLVRTPAPALGTLIALLALPAGIYLGKNLYLNTTYASHLEEGLAAQAEELPLDIFNDFPDYSIGSVYVNLAEEG